MSNYSQHPSRQTPARVVVKPRALTASKAMAAASGDITTENDQLEAPTFIVS